MRAYRKAYHERNPGAATEHNRKWREANREKILGYHLKREYGITYEEYLEMLEAADYKCSICTKPLLNAVEKGKSTDKACVDHCHATGRVRGILCNYCNQRLEFFEKHKPAIEEYLKHD